MLSVNPKKGFHIFIFLGGLSSQSGKNDPLFIRGNDCAWYTHYLNKKNEIKNKNCMIISIKNPLLTAFFSFLVNNVIPNQSTITIFFKFQLPFVELFNDRSRTVLKSSLFQLYYIPIISIKIKLHYFYKKKSYPYKLLHRSND